MRLGVVVRAVVGVGLRARAAVRVAVLSGAVSSSEVDGVSRSRTAVVAADLLFSGTTGTAGMTPRGAADMVWW